MDKEWATTATATSAACGCRGCRLRWRGSLPLAAEVAQHRQQALARAERQLQKGVVAGSGHGPSCAAIQRHQLQAQLATHLRPKGREQQGHVCRAEWKVCLPSPLQTPMQQLGWLLCHGGCAPLTCPMLPSSIGPDSPAPLLLRKLCAALARGACAPACGWLPAVWLLLAGCWPEAPAPAPSCAPVWLSDPPS